MAAEKKNFNVRVDAALCKGCGYCKELCPKGVYDYGSEYNAYGYNFMAVIDMNACIGCHTCMMVCPDFAVAVVGQ